MWRLREYEGLFRTPEVVEITDVYSIVMGTLGIDLRPRLRQDIQTYTPEEAESIRKQLEWLGYL